jgi:hypothetical protein
LLCSGGFPLQHASLQFMPQHGGSFKTCVAAEQSAFPSNPAYGQDITYQLTSGTPYYINISTSGAGATSPYAQLSFSRSCWHKLSPQTK